jgi:hypothetical protein
MEEEIYNVYMTKKYIAVVIIIVALVAAGIFWANPKDKSKQGLTEDKISSTEMLEITMEPTEVKGKIEGKVCYPSSFIPEGKILVKNTVTGEVLSQDFRMEGQNQKFVMELAEGKYMAAYQPNEIEIMGFYSQCALEMENCATPESHRLKEIEVKPGVTVEKVDICDYYYQPENKPKW